MSVDRRIREGLERSSRVIDPDPWDGLNEAIVRGQRRRLARRGLQASVVSGLVVLAVALGPAAVEMLRETQRPRPGTTTETRVPPQPYQVIAGTYTATLEPASQVVRDNGMAGEWILRLRPTSVLLLSPPPGFGATPAGISFQLDGDLFRTNAFINDLCPDFPVGVYRWERSGDTLTFTPTNEPCDVRLALFGSGPWTISL